MSAPTLPIPYCGLPPSPETLWSRWNLDPILISVFLLLVGIYALGAWRARHTRVAASLLLRRLGDYRGGVDFAALSAFGFVVCGAHRPTHAPDADRRAARCGRAAVCNRFQSMAYERTGSRQ